MQRVTCKVETEFSNIIGKKFVSQNIKEEVDPGSNYKASRIPGLNTR
jgi:hypothetical protein